jgi:hypothetical protein
MHRKGEASINTGMPGSDRLRGSRASELRERPEKVGMVRGNRMRVQGKAMGRQAKVGDRVGGDRIRTLYAWKRRERQAKV